MYPRVQILNPFCSHTGISGSFAVISREKNNREHCARRIVAGNSILEVSNYGPTRMHVRGNGQGYESGGKG